MEIRCNISGTLPLDWRWKESITFLAPNGRANVIASSEPLNEDLDSLAYATIQGNLLRTEFPAYVEHEFGPTDAFGYPGGYMRRFEWTPPDGEPVMQLQLYSVQSNRGYTSTATTPKQEYLSVEATLLDLLLSLRIAG